MNSISAPSSGGAAAWASITGIPAPITSWEGITRAGGFDNFVAAPTIANLNTLVSDADLAKLAGNAFTAANTTTLAALGTTPTAADSLINSTAAAAGAQQVSPSTVWTGQGWKTDATAASQQVDFRAYVLPVEAAAAPTGLWKLQSQIAGGGFTDRFTVSSAGDAVVGASLTVAVGFTVTTGNTVIGGNLTSIAGGAAKVTGVNGLVIDSGTPIVWGSSGLNSEDLFLRRKAAATLQLGTDAAGVTNQNLTAANRITSDGVGADFTIAPGNGRGGAGGSLILATYDTGAAATAGTIRQRLVIDTAGAISFPVVTAVVTETVVSDRTLAVTINGTAYKICLKV